MRHRHFRGPRGPFTGIAIALLAAAAIVGQLVVSSAGATPTGKTLTPTQQGLRFYRGKTITWIVPGAVGGTIDALARGLQPYVAQYLHASVDVENIPAGNTIAGQDALAAADPDGLTVGELSIVNDAIAVITKAPGLNFNPLREAFLAQNNGPAAVFVSQTTPNCPYSSVASLRDASSPTSELIVTSGTTADEAKVWTRLLGIKANLIAGYSSIVAQFQGFARGDGCIANLTLNQVGPLIQAGKARVLFLPGNLSVGTAYRSVVLASNPPTLAQLEKKYPPKTKLAAEQWKAIAALYNLTGNPIVTQGKVASDKILALRAAIAWAFRQPGFTADAEANAIGPRYISPTLSKANYATAIKDGGSIACIVEGSC